MRMAYKPDFVRAFQPLMTIHLGILLPAHSSSQPGFLGGKTRRLRITKPLFGFAPDGACRALAVTCKAVGSYSTVSPLPTAGDGRFVFCGAFPRVAPAGR